MDDVADENPSDPGPNDSGHPVFTVGMEFEGEDKLEMEKTFGSNSAISGGYQEEENPPDIKALQSPKY